MKIIQKANYGIWENVPHLAKLRYFALTSCDTQCSCDNNCGCDEQCSCDGYCGLDGEGPCSDNELTCTGAVSH